MPFINFFKLVKFYFLEFYILMKINDSNRNLNFGRLITTIPAEKLLKRADKAVKASNAVYLDVNIPEGHRLPLWSVLSKLITERQAANKNNIVIDAADDVKNNLRIKTYDSKGFVHKEWQVNPYPVVGSMQEVLGSNGVIMGSSKGNTIYGKSRFFDAIDSAEFDADTLNSVDIAGKSKSKVSSKLLPKDEEKRRLRVLKRMESLYKRIVPHVQRPFINLRKMISESLRNEGKAQPKARSEKLPRKLKKAAKKSEK